LLEEGLFSQAHETLERALSANPDHLEARLNSALALLYQREKPDEAEHLLQDVQQQETALTPALRARLLAARAELALAHSHPDEAMKSADAALAVLADDAYALFSRARALAAKKDPGARAAFEAAVAKHRTAPLLYLEGAKSLQQAGDGAGALALLDAYEAAFRAALERDDRYWLTRGGVLAALGREDESLAAYDKAISVKGPSRARAQYAKGVLLLARKDYPQAHEVLSALTPETGAGPLPEAYAAMGGVLFGQGDYAAGCQHYYFALSRDRARGVPLAQLQARALAVGQQLTEAGQPNMAKAWKTETDALLQ
jgi:tetratricopeptide (TPR) repeat protein